jgi:uncharacterized protein (TIGR00730 family)
MGNQPAARAAAEALGAGLAAAGIGLIYGGGHIGLMGVVADAVLDGGGHVTGVIPEFLARREVAHDRLSALHVTDSMHSRKRMMFELSDAFITMPGGLGTLDETIEIITWRQLGLHNKPVLICDVGGWAGPLLAALRASVEQGFAGADSLDLFEELADVPAVLARLERVAHRTPAELRRL